MTTWVKVTLPQVRVVLLLVSSSIKVKVNPEGKVPRLTSRLPPTDIVVPEYVTTPEEPLVNPPSVTQPVPEWVMVPLLVRTLGVLPPGLVTVQTPEAMVIVPLLVNVLRSLTAVAGLAPRGRVHPEERIMSPPESLVMTTWVNVTEPQVMVVSSLVDSSMRVRVSPEGNVPEATLNTPETDMVVPE